MGLGTPRKMDNRAGDTVGLWGHQDTGTRGSPGPAGLWTLGLVLTGAGHTGTGSSGTGRAGRCWQCRMQCPDPLPSLQRSWQQGAGQGEGTRGVRRSVGADDGCPLGSRPPVVPGLGVPRPLPRCVPRWCCWWFPVREVSHPWGAPSCWGAGRLGSAVGAQHHRQNEAPPACMSQHGDAARLGWMD